METNKDAVILIVDDKRHLADLYTVCLSDDYTVKTAYSGQDALDQLDASVDILLLNRRMPDLTGEDVLATIQEYGFSCQFALVTSITPDTDILDLGFDDYLQKPVTEPELHTLVESLVVRLTCSETLQEYFALVSERVVLQTELDADDLTDHPELRRLDAQIRALREEINGLLEEFTDTDFRATFHALSPDKDGPTSFESFS